MRRGYRSSPGLLAFGLAVVVIGCVGAGVPTAHASLVAPVPVASPAVRDAVGASTVLRPGSSGPAVRALQARLTSLGYWLGTADGQYGLLTTQAVIALQKVAGLERDGVLGPKTQAALNVGARPTPRSSSGHVVEIDLAHQVLLVVDGGRLSRVLDTSTGSGAWYTDPDGHRAHAITPTGHYAVQRVVDGWDSSPLGQLYRPRYFNGGIAVHGYASVPAYPASHGCVRVSLAAMDLIWAAGLMPRGAPVWVY